MQGLPHPYVVQRDPAAAANTFGVWNAGGDRSIAQGLRLKAALSMRDRLNDQARRATSIAPPHAR